MAKQLTPHVDEAFRKSLKRLEKRVKPEDNRLAKLLDKGTVAGVAAEKSDLVAGMSAQMKKRIRGVLRSGSDSAVICEKGVDTGAVHFHYVVVSNKAAKDAQRLDIALDNAGRLLEIMESPRSLATSTIASLKAAQALTPGRGTSVNIEGLTNFDINQELVDLEEGIKDLEIRLPNLCGQGVGTPGADLGLLRKFKLGELQFLQGLFGDGVNYDRIRLSPLDGLGGSPFTIHIGGDVLIPDGVNLDIPLIEFGFTIINIGPTLYLNAMQPLAVPNTGNSIASGAILAHEVAHSWQSQHHTNGSAYMWNAILSQGLALIKYPGNGGNPAYTYTPGKKLKKYAAEQAANHVGVHVRGALPDAGENDIIAQMRESTTNLPNAQNMIGMILPRVEDPNASGNRSLIDTFV